MICYLEKMWQEQYYKSEYIYDKNQPVQNIIRSFFEWEKYKESIDYEQLSWSDKKEYRIKYDCDAYYYSKRYSKNEALRGDTMISFWTPYKYALKRETGWEFYKSLKSLKNLLLHSENHEYKHYRKIENLNQCFFEFAKICYSKGNFILLPDSNYKVCVEGKTMGMNEARWHFCEDMIDYTLYECKPGNKLSGFFEKENLCEWIKRERLEFIVPKGDNKRFENMTIKEIYAYVDYATAVIKKRTECITKIEGR